jgi:hypothetical protein
VYTLDDLYVIFAQEPTVEGKLELLRDWSQRKLGYDINWKRLIKVWSTF